MTLTASKMSVGHRLKNFCQYHKRGLVLSALLSMVAIVAVFMGLTVCEGEYIGQNEGNYGFLIEWSFKMIDDIVSVFDDVGGIVNVKIGGEDIALSLNTFLQEYAISILCILWIPSLLMAFINQQAYAEIVIKKLIVLGVGVFLITNSYMICEEFSKIGGEIVGQIDITNSNEEAKAKAVTLKGLIKQYADEVAKDCGLSAEDEEAFETVRTSSESEDESLLATSEYDRAKSTSKVLKHLFPKLYYTLKVKLGVGFMAIFGLLIPWVAMWGSYILMIVSAYGRAFEILIFSAISPIPFCLLTNEPLGTGAGTRFLKNLAALCLQGAIMMIIGKIGASVIAENFTGGTMQEAFSNSLKGAAIGLAIGSLMLKSLSISQKALGLQ